MWAPSIAAGAAIRADALAAGATLAAHAAAVAKQNEQALSNTVADQRPERQRFDRAPGDGNMTTVLHPPQLGPAQSPHPPPRPMAAGPSRVVIGAALVSLAASLGSVTVAGISWATAHSGSNPAATTSAASAPDAGQVAAARTKACQLWGTSANAMDIATNAVAHAPKDWNAPETQEALADEARVIIGGKRIPPSPASR